MKLEIKSLDAIVETAREFVKVLGPWRVIAFRGEMGAGKTTLIKAICKELGVVDEPTSPTFAIVNEYLSGNDQTIYHFDFYRIEDLAEAMDMGAAMYFESGNVCLIEWPEKIEPILPDGVLNVYMELQEDGSRLVQVGDGNVIDVQELI